MDEKVCTLSGLLEIQLIQFNKQQETIRATKEKQDSLELDMKRMIEHTHENRVKLVEQTRVSLEEQSAKITQSLALIEAMKHTVLDHTNQLTDLSSKQRLHTEKIDILLRDLTSMYRDLGNMENSKMDRIHCTNLLNDLRKHSEKLYTEISLKENHIVTIENFIEKYLPVRILSQISEIFKAVIIKPDIIARITLYEREKYS